jgi:hypothetical protein
MFAEDKRNNYPSAGLSPDQVSSMTYTMDELENGKGNVNPSVNSSPSLVNNNQVNANKSVKSSVNYNPYPGGTGANVGMDYLGGLYTSPEKEEELRKSSVNKQRVMALADALRHIGNIYHTTRYSPSQQFNSPVLEERNRYLKEKAVRDANNYKFQTYQQAKAAQEAKIRQAERDFDYKVNKDARDYELNKQKADAYLKAQEAQRGYTEARTANETKRGEGIEADNRLKSYKAEIAPQEFELKKRNTESQIAARKDASARGWANYNLSVRREQRMSKGGSYAGTDGKRDLYSSPDGSSYSFPKGVINSKTINTIYGYMLRKGLIDNDYDVTNDGEKWDSIMKAAGSSKQGHDAFIYHAKRLGYNYEGGMSPDVVQKYWGSTTQPKAQPKAQTPAAPKPTKSNVKAGATSNGSTPKAGTSSKPSYNGKMKNVNSLANQYGL